MMLYNNDDDDTVMVCNNDDDDIDGVGKTERECFGWECPEDLGSDDQLCQICSPRLG